LVRNLGKNGYDYLGDSLHKHNLKMILLELFVSPYISGGGGGGWGA